MNETLKPSDIQIELNRLYAKKAALEKQLKQRTKSNRMNRTRTLIQMGGLVAKSGLMDLCEITEGDDLQIDLINLDKAAILLGILDTTFNGLSENDGLKNEDMQRFLKIGKRLLKDG